MIRCWRAAQNVEKQKAAAMLVELQIALREDLQGWTSLTHAYSWDTCRNRA